MIQNQSTVAVFCLVSRIVRRSMPAAPFVLLLTTIGSGTLLGDDVVEVKGAKTFRGEIAEVSRTEIVVKGRSNRDYRIAANDIVRIQWEGEKAPVLQMRIDENNGHFNKAIAGYRAALDEASGGSANLRGELEFLLARATAGKALAEQEHYEDAISQLEKFRTGHPTSYRYFDALRLLSRLYMRKGDLERANSTLKLMAEAPWSDYQMETQILKARAALAHDDVAAALASLEAVIAVKPTSKQEISRRYEALLAKAMCLEKTGKFQEAVDVLQQILDEADENDTQTLAEACVRLGDCYQAAGRTKEAILSYLRVDVLFSKDKAHHAEALYHLSRLFLQDGKSDKAADAATRLQHLYASSEWAKKASVDRPVK